MNLALGAWPVLGSQPLLISPRISAGYLQGDTQVRAWQGERESRGSGSPSLGAWHSPALSRWARCSLPMAACSLLMTLPLCNPNPSCSAKSLPSFKAPQGTMVFKHLPAPGGRGLPCISATCNHAPHYHTNLRSLKELQTGGLLPGSLSGTRTMFTPRKWSSANFTQVTRYPRCAPPGWGGLSDTSHLVTCHIVFPSLIILEYKNDSEGIQGTAVGRARRAGLQFCDNGQGTETQLPHLENGHPGLSGWAQALWPPAGPRA